MKRFTVYLFCLSLMIAFLGIAFIYSTSAYFAQESYGDGFYFARRQMLWLFIGLCAQIMVMRLGANWFYKNAWFIMLANVLLLLMVLVPALSVEVGGARRWIRLLGFSFQPSEFCKLATIIFMARFLADRQDVISTFWKGFVWPFVILMAVIALILAERDLGTSIILGSVVMLMFYVAGIRLIYLGMLVLTLVPLFFVAITKYSFRMQRILTYLDPWKDPQNAGYQIIQSMIAIGSGGWLGKGIGASLQKYYYLPEVHTDFIFSIYAEEVGFVGCLLLLALFLALIIAGLRVALRAKNAFDHFLAIGLTFLLSIQVSVNIGVVTSLLPTKGTPLPFISFGGTSLVVNMVAVGLLIAIEKRSRHLA